MSEPTTIATATLPTPVGDVVLYEHGDALCGLVFVDRTERLQEHLRRRFGEVIYRSASERNSSGAVGRVRDYLAGDLRAVDDVAGRSRRHAVSGARLGGAAPHPARRDLLVRRHRRARSAAPPPCAPSVPPTAPTRCRSSCPAIASSAPTATLHGYGGGLPRKQWLLAHERALLV